MDIRLKIIVILFFATLLGSCINPYVAVIEQTNPTLWSGVDTICIDYNNEDTLSLFELSFILRVNKDYNDEDLVLSVVTSDSTKSIEVDHITVANIPRERGISRYRSVVIPFRDRVKLNNGSYKFCISHNKGSIKSIHAVGIEINPSGI